MNIMRTLVLVAGVSALGACADFNKFDEVSALNDASASGSPFTQRLTAEYKTFVNSELKDMGDQADALHFSRKGLAAARGDAVMPEPVSDWNLQSAHVTELSSGRARLINVFDLGARELQPDLSAVAQARFDCWIEQQEENFQPDDIAACKKEVLDALQQLEGMMPPPAAPVAPPAAPADPFGGVDPNAQMAAENAKYLVFFDFDKYDINSGAAAVLDSVANEVRSRQLNGLHVVGHADKSGTNEYNMRLATRRANAIKDGLTSRGINGGTITTESRGEEEPLVDTPDGVREPANRRGEITFR